MFVCIKNFRFFAHCLLICFALGPVLPLTASTPPHIARNQSSPQSSDTPPNRIPSKPQRLYAPHWTTEDGFQTNVYVRNLHIEQAVTARLSLVLDHRTITLPPTQIDPLQTVSIDVARALADNGEKFAQAGGATIEFDAESAGQVGAYAHVLDTARSLSFSFPFTSDGSSAPGPLEAVSWYYSRTTDAFVALQNTTDKEASALPTIFVSGRSIGLGKKQLKPHETAIIKVPSLEISPSTEGPRTIGVRIEYTGDAGAVVAQGWAIDERIGFSAPFSFHHKTSCNCASDVQHLYGAGIMIGAGGMGNPSVVFSPYIALRNKSREQVTMSSVFSFEVAGKVETVTLPGVALGPEETAVINLRKYQEEGLFPLAVEMGDIDLQYEGDPGALVAELASVDQSGTFVSPVPLTCNGNPDQHMVFWRTDGDWHSSVTIENTTSRENDIEITISYPGGTYVFDKTIPPNATTMVSINELQQSQTPGTSGSRIPADAKMGGINLWSRSGRDGIVINAMLVNSVTKTCGTCGGSGYVLYVFPVESYANIQTASGFEPHSIGDQFGMRMVLVWSTGNRSSDFCTNMHCSNPSVADMSGSNMVCYSPGTTGVTGYTSSPWPDDTECDYLLIFGYSGAGLTVVSVKIKQDGTDITGTTHNVIVGQKISLTAEILPAGTSTTNNQWTIPGTRIANYVVQYTDQLSPTTATVTSLTNLTATSVDFYWVDGADGRTVTFSFKVSGKSFNAGATFNVKRPTTQITSTTGAVSINTAFGNLEMSFGTPTARGIVFSGEVSIPQGFSGDTQWVQVVTISKTRTLTDGTVQTASGSGLDTYYPYPGNDDSPGVDLTSSYTQRTVNDGYQTYLMFKPSIANSIWVPLRVLSWSWSGTATLSGGTWNLSNANHSQNPVGADAIIHPKWNQNAALIAYH